MLYVYGLNNSPTHAVCGTPYPHKRCHWFFPCNFYKYRWIFLIFVHNFARECQGTWYKNLLPHFHSAATVPCTSLRHKSNTFHTILALCTCLSIKFAETSIDKTNKIHQKVIGSKFMFKMSTIHNTEHMHSNDYVTVQLLPRWWSDPAASTPSADVLTIHIMDTPDVI